jgi:uncharacterized membrane protein
MVSAVQIKKEIVMNKVLNKIIWPVILVPAAYLAIIWNKLPEIIPVHFDMKGHADRYGDKKELFLPVIILSVLSLFVYFLFTNIYRIDPKKYAAENKSRLQRIGFAVAIFMVAMTCMIIYSGVKGGSVFNISIILSGVGLLFAIIGNYMHNIKPNYYAGFRLPWTLNNNENWKKTHALAGRLWFAGGLLLAVICVFLTPVISMIIFFTVMTVITIIPGVYSYRLYKKQKAQNSVS